MHIDTTRSPGLCALPSGALRTVPATSAPGMNGSSGLSWYSPRLCSTSGNETPATSTSMITTSPSGASGWVASGSGTSTTCSPWGPVSSLI